MSFQCNDMNFIIVDHGLLDNGFRCCLFYLFLGSYVVVKSDQVLIATTGYAWQH